MVKRKANGDNKEPSKTKMDIDGEEDESEDVRSPSQPMNPQDTRI